MQRVFFISTIPPCFTKRTLEMPAELRNKAPAHKKLLPVIAKGNIGGSCPE